MYFFSLLTNFFDQFNNIVKCSKNVVKQSKQANTKKESSTFLKLKYSGHLYVFYITKNKLRGLNPLPLLHPHLVPATTIGFENFHVPSFQINFGSTPGSSINRFFTFCTAKSPNL